MCRPGTFNPQPHHVLHVKTSRLLRLCNSCAHSQVSPAANVASNSRAYQHFRSANVRQLRQTSTAACVYTNNRHEESSKGKTDLRGASVVWSFRGLAHPPSCRESCIALANPISSASRLEAACICHKRVPYKKGIPKCTLIQGSRLCISQHVTVRHRQLQRLRNLGLGTSGLQLSLGLGSILLGGTLQHHLGQGGSEVLDLVDGNAGNGADNLVDANLQTRGAG